MTKVLWNMMYNYFKSIRTVSIFSYCFLLCPPELVQATAILSNKFGHFENISIFVDPSVILLGFVVQATGVTLSYR